MFCNRFFVFKRLNDCFVNFFKFEFIASKYFVQRTYEIYIDLIFLVFYHTMKLFLLQIINFFFFHWQFFRTNLFFFLHIALQRIRKTLSLFVLFLICSDLFFIDSISFFSKSWTITLNIVKSSIRISFIDIFWRETASLSKKYKK